MEVFFIRFPEKVGILSQPGYFAIQHPKLPKKYKSEFFMDDNNNHNNKGSCMKLIIAIAGLEIMMI